MSHIDPELLKRYASGNCSEQEIKIVEQWLDTAAIPEDADTFKGLDKKLLRQEIWSATGADVPLPDRKKSWSFPLKIAASLIFCCFAGYGSYQLYQSAVQAKKEGTITDQNLVVLPGQKVKVTLADGTIVQLNGDSKFRYPKSFSQQGAREVYLSGEAHFTVTKDPSRPFMIHAAGTLTKVLGTVFNLQAYAEQKGAILTVESGKVQFSDEVNPGKSLVLTAGKQGVYTAGQGLQLQEVQAATFTAWKDSKMIIKKSTLEEIALLITRWYGAKVVVRDPQLLHARFTGTYQNTALETLAKDISLAFHCNYKFDQHTLIFY